MTDRKKFPFKFHYNFPFGGKCAVFIPGTTTKRPKRYPFHVVDCSGGPFRRVAFPLCQAAKKVCSTPIKCPERYRPLGGRCYRHDARVMTYADALSTCRSEGATLIEPRSVADLNLMKAQWGPLGNRYSKGRSLLFPEVYKQ